ncbi:Type VI secretion system Vgr family protein [Candidatus Bealeia paramacronuclearis]|nr:Type VI secretion system Vgr family protein [Candidatus Bealeia paramacronuclearis]
MEQISTPPNGYKVVTQYKAKLYPKFWLLTFSSNCKIYQNQTALDIIKSILTAKNIKVSDKTQSRGKSQIEFCVQYNESDFNFICRLLEKEGIFYFFEQSQEGETLVLGDSADAHMSCPNVKEAKIAFGDVTQPFLMSVVECRLVQKVVPTSHKIIDYSYQTPSTALNANQSGPDNAYGGEMYHYPGGFQQQTDGDSLVKLRLEAEEMPRESVEGTSTIPFFMAGYSFSLSSHPRTSLNAKYILYEVRHEARLTEETDENGSVIGTKIVYLNRYKGIPATKPIRPPMITPKPRIFGTQTAKVTGKEGEEIFTEDLGRIKVKFHWDTSEAKDDTTSCWIRVAYPWAGQQWGFISTPRVGQEVVVAFIDGNPDFPIVVGSVYNGENKPPYLPDQTTQSGIKSNSSKGGKGSNEFRFDDKKGSEEVYFHAQKDYKKVVEHNETVEIVGGTRDVTLKAQASSEGGEGGGEGGGSYNDKLTLNNGDKTVKIVKGNYEITLDSGNMTITMSAGDMTIKASGNITVDAGQTITLKAGDSINMTATNSISGTANAIDMKAETNISNNAGTNFSVDAGAAIEGQAGANINLTAGGAIEATAGGDVSATAGGAAEITGGGDVTVTAGGACEVTGGGTLALTGATVEIDGAAVLING